MVDVGIAPSWSTPEPKRYGTPRPPSAIRPSAVRWAYMYACASSPSVSNRSQPIDRQASSPSGPVTIIELFIGSSVRCWPEMSAVNPSVQRTI